MRQQILVDMDGVLADVYAQLTFRYRDSGQTEHWKHVMEKPNRKLFLLSEKHVRSKGFFRTAPLIPGSIEGLKYLNEKYNVLLYLRATEFPQSPGWKGEGLSEPFSSSRGNKWYFAAVRIASEETSWSMIIPRIFLHSMENGIYLHNHIICVCRTVTITEYRAGKILSGCYRQTISIW